MLCSGRGLVDKALVDERDNSLTLASRWQVLQIAECRVQSAETLLRRPLTPVLPLPALPSVPSADCLVSCSPCCGSRYPAANQSCQSTMDSQSHRKLTKKPPIHSETHSTHRSLRRTPSAPMHPSHIQIQTQTQGHHRETSSPSPTATASSRSSASRQQHRQSYQRSPHSAHAQGPMLFGEIPSISHPRDSLYTPQARQSVTEKTSSELIGAPFDSAAVLSNFNPTSPLGPPQQSRPPPSQPQPQPQQTAPSPPSIANSPPQQQNLTAQFTPAQTFEQILKHQPAPLQQQPSKRTSITQALASPRLRQSASFYGPVNRQMETATPPRSDRSDTGGTQSPRQRYSDEANGSGGAKLRKKSGISNVLDKFLSSPRKPQISAPENPVHVTHVGYNEETGEFTVRRLLFVITSPRSVWLRIRIVSA